MESEFRIVAGADRSALVVLHGVVDARNAPLAQEAIRRAAWPGRAWISVDVGGLAEIDGSGMRALVSEALDARRAGRPLRLRRARPPLIDRLLRNGFLDLFGLDTVVDAPCPFHRGAVRIIWKEERFTSPARLCALPEIRHRIVRFCQGLGLRGDTLDGVHLAAGEAVTNAIRHGCAENPDCTLDIRCAARDDRLVTEVHDPGSGFDPSAVRPPDPEEMRPGGMGIHLMRAMMDDVEFEFDGEGTVVRLVKRLPPLVAAGLSILEGGLGAGLGELMVDD